MKMAWISPSPVASEQQDLPSPGVGEDLRLCRRLDKYWEKYGVSFFTIRSLPYKRGDETTLEGPKSMGGAPKGVGAPAHLLGSLLTSWWPTLAHLVRLQKLGTWAFGLLNSDSRSSWKVKNTKKEVFCLQKLNTDKEDFIGMSPKII